MRRKLYKTENTNLGGGKNNSEFGLLSSSSSILTGEISLKAKVVSWSWASSSQIFDTNEVRKDDGEELKK